MTAGLLALQETDVALLRLESRLAVLESGEEVAALRSAYQAAESHLGELRLERDSLTSGSRRMESDIDMQSQRLAAEEKRLYDGSVTNMKELEAIQHEIASIKERRGRIEDDLLERMERLEELELSISEAETATEAARAIAEQAESGAEAELAQVLADLERETALRATRASMVDPEVLELYDELRSHKKGIGAAALVDGVCQGCHETLSPMELDRLKHSDDIKRCEHCRRILVL
jgi:predicted  nucleic acid-binding Zn-ribbon protein